ncbi:RNA degradosome polyphosphate kinase [Rothia koreensis]|uniref:RNA degradosome polyphosphate kinase n=1 Tax=Rothia koreensis TaxID=592378 RepID=UPI003FCDAD11
MGRYAVTSALGNAASRYSLDSTRPDSNLVGQIENLAQRAHSADGAQPLSEQTLVQLRRAAEQSDGASAAPLVITAFEGEALVAAAVATAPEDAESTGTVEGMVDPKHRGSGLGRAVAEMLLGDSGLGEQVNDYRVWVHGSGVAGRSREYSAPLAAMSLADSFGYVPVRELWKMRLDLTAKARQSIRELTEKHAPEPPVHVRTFQDSDAEAWVDLNSRAFADHPEQGQLGIEDLRARQNDSWFRPEGFFLAETEQDSSGNPALLGFHWTKIEDTDQGSREGEVYAVGVSPDAQGTGLGRALTVIGMDYLARFGEDDSAEEPLDAIVLYVDADNTAAVGLYESLGFRPWDVDKMYAPSSAVTDEDTVHAEPEAVTETGQNNLTHPGQATNIAKIERAETRGDRIDAPEQFSTPLLQGDFGPERFADRESSWLDFNTRVLELAEDPSLYLLERLNFLSIVASNLDEFFMVRVAGLKRRIATGIAVPSASGLTPDEQMELISESAHRLQQHHAEVFHDQVLPELEKAGLHVVGWDDLEAQAQERLSGQFRERVFPILTPLAVDPAHPFPYISGLSLNLAVIVRNPQTGKELFARIKVPDQLDRMISVDGSRHANSPSRSARFIPLEAIIAEHLDELFPGMEVVEHHVFRVTRNEDLEVEEDDAENLLQALEKELLRRRFGPPVRLEVEDTINPAILDLLVSELRVDDAEVYRLPAPLDLRGMTGIVKVNRPSLHYPKHIAHTSRFLNAAETATAADVFSATREHDVLLQHPYDSFATSVQAFLEQAASDPQVMAIKQTLYRTSGDSPIVDALIEAAEAGKQVLAVVEIKARFDEQANISWARKLEEAGVHVVYGIVGLKTHCKLSLVVRKESDGLRRYCHIGTGNYHPSTARFYEDLGLLTCDPQVAEDVSRLFNQLSGYAPKTAYKSLLVAPRSLRSGLIDRINREISHKRAGLNARIQIKCNSMVDEAIIDSLYRASQAGVEVNIVVRGICALRPGVPGLSENIRVRSVLGRFLEHSRVFTFENGGKPVAYIGSADMMHRNLDRRVEALVRIKDPVHIRYLLDMIGMYMSEKTANWHLESDGTWTRFSRAADGTPLRDVQSRLLESRSQRGMYPGQ